MNTTELINEIRKENTLYKYNNILENTIIPIKTKHKIKEAIEDLTKTVEVEDNYAERKKQMSDFLSGINKLYERKNWASVPEVIKKRKIRDYVDSLIHVTDEQRTEFKDTLCNLVEKKKLGKKKYVEYDKNKTKIMVIHLLVYNKDKKTYELKLDKSLMNLK